MANSLRRSRSGAALLRKEQVGTEHGSSEQFPIEEVFNEDYMYFVDAHLSEERSNKEALFIWERLGLWAGARVLDVACGYGRLANRLAAAGAQVTGLDYVPRFLAEAKERGRANGVVVDYHLGDMRRLPVRWKGAFDAALLWYNAFGYFSEEENLATLRGIARSLRVGGRFLVDQPHRNALVRRDFPVQEVTERDGNLLVTTSDYNPITDRIRVERLIVRNGARRRVAYSIRIYSFLEIASLLKQAGFCSVEPLGEDGGPLTLKSPRILCLAIR